MAIELYDMTFGGINASTYNVFTLSGEKIYDMPTRQVELIDIPGRNGSLPIDKGSYNNITVEYDCFCYGTNQADFKQKISAFTNAIASKIGYQRLSDTYHSDTYRMAMFIEGLEVTKVTGNENMGRFTLKFNCKPQRYLISGETEIEVDNGDVVNNPTLFDASPLLMIDGYGTVAFNGYEIETQNRNVNTVTLWDNTAKSFDNDNQRYENSKYYLDVSMSQTFNKAMFNNGDTFSFKATVKAFEGYYTGDATTVVTKTDSNSTVSGDANGNAVITKNCNFTVGTASTLTNTVTLKQYDGGTLVNTGIDVVSIAYDGNDKVTITVNRTNDDLMYMLLTEIIMYKATGVSSVSLHDYTYVDCELGEAYKYNDGQIISLNSYVDLGSDLPKLASGNNTFALDNTITSLVLVPRWWKL